MTEEERLRIDIDKMELLLRTCSLETNRLNIQQQKTLAKLIDKLSEQLKL